LFERMAERDRKKGKTPPIRFLQSHPQHAEREQAVLDWRSQLIKEKPKELITGRKEWKER
jgi:hypothetical protein